MLYDSDTALYELLSDVDCRRVVLHSVLPRLGAYAVYALVEQITLGWAYLAYSPVVAAGIFRCGELSVFVGVIGVHKLAAAVEAVRRPGERSVTARGSGLGVGLSDGDGELLKHVVEAALSHVVPEYAHGLALRHDIAICCVHFLDGVRRIAAYEDVFKVSHAVRAGHGVLVHFKTRGRSAVEVECDALDEIVLGALAHLQRAALERIVKGHDRALASGYGDGLGVLRRVRIRVYLGDGVPAGH